MAAPGGARLSVSMRMDAMLNGGSRGGRGILLTFLLVNEVARSQSLRKSLPAIRLEHTYRAALVTEPVLRIAAQD